MPSTTLSGSSVEFWLKNPRNFKLHLIIDKFVGPQYHYILTWNSLERFSPSRVIQQNFREHEKQTKSTNQNHFDSKSSLRSYALQARQNFYLKNIGPEASSTFLNIIFSKSNLTHLNTQKTQFRLLIMVRLAQTFTITNLLLFLFSIPYISFQFHNFKT